MKKYRWLVLTGIIMAAVLVMARAAVVGATDLTGGMGKLSHATSEKVDAALMPCEEMAALLVECLEYIEDGGDWYPTYTIDDLVVHSIPGSISHKKAELNRLERETELHNKIKKIIKQLKGATNEEAK
jgi:hypothetical protein